MNKKIAEIAGWYGTVVIILAYLFVSFGYLSPNSFTYQFLNLTGALGFIAITWIKGVYQSVIINIIWSGIALVAIIRIFLN